MPREHRAFIASVTVLGDELDYVSEWHSYQDAWEAALAKAQDIVVSEAMDKNRADWGVKIYVCDIPTSRPNVSHQRRREK
jgi:hypothetical protein